MEKIKVNMSPNPLDVQTIHASQNDNEAREWGFELHNNGDAIDSSEISDQMVFKAYKGGTEQILPENTSTPTTSPFKGDIKYPQGLLSDQEFLYRESPTEEDGLAKIKSIKGNTLVWNQLQLIPTNPSTTSNGITFTNNNDGSVTANGTATGTAIFYCNSFPLTSGHKYLFKGCPSGGTSNTYMQSIRVNSASTIIGTDVGNGDVYTANANYTDGTILLRIMSGVTLNNAKFYPQVFDLTQMGLDSLTVEDFTSLFPLPYYAYNQGTLLSFMGNGIKTVGKNRLNYDAWKTVRTSNGTSVWENNGVTITATANDAYTLYNESTFPVNARIPVREGKTITLSWESDDNVNGDVYIFPNGTTAGSVKINNRLGKSLSYTPINGVEYVTIRFGVLSSGNIIHFKNIMIRFDDADNTFEPYKENITSLPIQTYFPSGMKSAGTVYDELTPTKGITRIGAVDLGTLSWEEQSTVTAGKNRFRAVMPTNAKIQTSDTTSNKSTCSKFALIEPGKTYQNNDGYTISVVSGSTLYVYVYDSSMASLNSSDFKTAMSGVYLYYELATPTETSFTTASLVTENTEIPLSNEDGVLVGKCTEQLSEIPGFFDAKIKLSDADGTCYSNKLQLHVERSPQ